MHMLDNNNQMKSNVRSFNREYKYTHTVGLIQFINSLVAPTDVPPSWTLVKPPSAVALA